jgi:cold shock CspA family protein
MSEVFLRGTVVTWRGSFGFISPACGGPDVFVHAREIAGDLQEGQRVAFQVRDSARKPGTSEAVGVKAVDP